MALKLEDLIALGKADDEKKMLDFNSREVFKDPESRERLLAEGLILKGGALTELGMKALAAVRKKESELRDGIPFNENNKRDPKRLYKETVCPWMFVVLGKDQVVANGEILFVGRPETAMGAKRGDESLKRMLQAVIRKCGKKGLIQVWPHTYQSFSLGGVDIVWLSDEKQEKFIPVLARYYDFMAWRFPKAQFFASSPEEPVQVRVRSKGIRSTVGIIATFDVAGELRTPKLIDNWRKDVQSEDVSLMAEGDRSPLREGEEE